MKVIPTPLYGCSDGTVVTPINACGTANASEKTAREWDLNGGASTPSALWSSGLRDLTLAHHEESFQNIRFGLSAEYHDRNLTASFPAITAGTTVAGFAHQKDVSQRAKMHLLRAERAGNRDISCDMIKVVAEDSTSGEALCQSTIDCSWRRPDSGEARKVSAKVHVETASYNLTQHAISQIGSYLQPKDQFALAQTSKHAFAPLDRHLAAHRRAYAERQYQEFMKNECWQAAGFTIEQIRDINKKIKTFPEVVQAHALEAFSTYCWDSQCAEKCSALLQASKAYQGPSSPFIRQLARTAVEANWALHDNLVVNPAQIHYLAYAAKRFSPLRDRGFPNSDFPQPDVIFKPDVVSLSKVALHEAEHLRLSILVALSVQERQDLGLRLHASGEPPESVIVKASLAIRIIEQFTRRCPANPADAARLVTVLEERAQEVQNTRDAYLADFGLLDEPRYDDYGFGDEVSSDDIDENQDMNHLLGGCTGSIRDGIE